MLSIIVTFYDETAFLRTALRSVRNQGIAPLDLIVVNDNPEQFSRAQLAELADGFDARIIHHTENRGLSAARNTGMAAAKGDLIGFLDADDYYTPKGLAAQLAYARETQADITHAACYLSAPGAVHSQMLHRDAGLHRTQRVVEGRMTAQEAQFIVSSWSSLYRMDFLRDNNLCFDAEQRKFEDRLFVLHTVTAARKIAFLGRAVRVWRRRAGSISSQATTPETHLLQVQLLEKCLAHMQAQNLPPRFEKRELFNTVSRLIWDMDILDPLAAGDPAYADMGARITALLGEASFGQEIFTDPMVSATSRVGMKTKRGKISRAQFFALHKAWREGDYAAAKQIMADCAPAPADVRAQDHPQKRLVLHVGLHKTGSTYLQHHLDGHRQALATRGVLVPTTGFTQDVAGRAGALSGHQGLARALRKGDDDTWMAFHREVDASPARTVVLSSENLSMPTEEDRTARIATLFDRLGRWARIDVIAFLRPPQAYIEAFHAEWVAGGHPGGTRSLPEMLVDHAAGMTDMAQLFAPFEEGSGTPVTLCDFDAAREGPGLWPAFCQSAGLPEDLGSLDVPRYATPDRESVRLLQLVNMLVTDPARRRVLLDTYFASASGPGQRISALPPSRRSEIVAQFEEHSRQFCADRGYAPDMDAWHSALAEEDWHPMGDVPASDLATLVDVAAQWAGDADAFASLAGDAGDARRAPRARPRYSFVVRPRPWLVKVLDALFVRK